MHIEIKDLQSGEEHRIDEQGTTIGRDGGRATLSVPETGVSGLHARISFKEGAWWLEDLKSSNGSFVDKSRIREPFKLQNGTVFKLHTYAFEVVDLEVENDGGQTAVSNAETRVKAEAAIKPTAPVKKAAPAATPPPEEQESEAEDEEAKSEPISSPFDKSEAVKAEVSGAVKAGAPDIAGQARAAMTYYFAAVPKLAANPKATIANSIADQKFAAMKPMELLAWAIPALLLGQLVGVFVGLAAMIRAKTFAPVSFAISFVIAVAIAIIAGVIAAFIFHPVLNWLVNILKGKSDEKSRSNYFVIAMTAACLTTVVSGVGGLFALIPVPFIAVVPVLLGLVASLVTLYMAHEWFTHFGVVKWFLIVLKVLAVLAILSGLLNLYRTIDAQLTLSKASGVSADAIAAAQKAADNGAKLAGDAATAAEKAGADAGKAVEEAGKSAGGNADAAAAAAQAALAQAQAQAQAQGVAPGSDPAAAAQGAETEPAKIAGGKAAAAKEAKAAARAAGAGKGVSQGDYETYLKKRDEIEQAIGKNPTLLTRTPGVLPLYKQLHKEMDGVKAKYRKSDKDDVVAQRLRDAEIFDKTAEAVDVLHAKLLE